MSDAEWQAWQQAFQKKSNPLPAIAKGVRSATWRIRGSRIVFFGIVALEVVAAGGFLAVRGTGATVVHIAGLGILLMMMGMTIAYVRANRGIWRQASAQPEAQLQFMENWVRASERAALAARYGGVVACGFTLVLNVAVWMEERPPLWMMAGVLAFIAFVAVTTWIAPTRVGKRLEKRRAQLAAWRAELTGALP